MAAFYHINNITLGKPSLSGHETYLNATYVPDNKRIIYKKNKWGNSAYSRLEVSFSQLAKLFLSRDLTPSQRLVVDAENKVLGVAVKHLCYVINKKEKNANEFYTLTAQKNEFEFAEQNISKPEEIPIYFLDKLPQGFFAKLRRAEKEENISIDYESLASILATSYTMEEDDLHKGNFGFYIVKKNGKPHFVFFKIDHDLMFVDSIMGFHTRRPFHLFHGPRAFDITAEDLLNFPNLGHSANSYWPTKFGYISNPFDSKEFHSFAENRAFAKLATRPEFINAKWKTFYKHILTPKELIKSTLINCAEFNNANDRAHIALMTQTMIARLANLRAVLFSLKPFRDYVKDLSDTERSAILREIVSEGDPLESQVLASFERYELLCSSAQVITEGDTPLHTAIKLGEYRYEDTIRMFDQFINVKNNAGKTPLDVALERMQENDKLTSEDVGKDMRYIMKHLLAYGARQTRRFKKANIVAEIEAYEFANPYLPLISATNSYAEVKDILRTIGEDHRFCLKYKKNLAIACIKQWIHLRENKANFQKELEQLRNDVNEKSSDTECAGLKYLRQLRSKLWVIRQLRGLYGITTTQREINRMIDRAKPKEPVYCSFFSNSQVETNPFANISTFSI